MPPNMPIPGMPPTMPSGPMGPGMPPPPGILMKRSGKKNIVMTSVFNGPFTQSVSVSGDAKKWVQNPFTLQH